MPPNLVSADQVVTCSWMNDKPLKHAPLQARLYHPYTIHSDGFWIEKMTHPNMNTLLEATRLTRTGQLSEAMSLLRGLASPHMPHAAQSGSWAAMQNGPAGRAASVLDMVPPAPGTGSA